MANNTQTCLLNKLILNNFIIQSRPLVRRGKLHVINKVVRRVRQLRQQKATNEKDKEKFIRKADKLLEELPVLKSFHPDELMKFALLNKKSLIEVTNDPSSHVEERALCRIASWKTVAPEVNKFREQHPDWEEKLPVLLKNLGLQYRRKRLKRIEKRGQKEKFLEKEHNNLMILQKFTNIDIDPRLLAKAGKLMKASKKEDGLDNTRVDKKNKVDKQIRKKQTRGLIDSRSNIHSAINKKQENDGDIVQKEKQDADYQHESSEEEQFHEDEKVLSKHSLRTQKTHKKASLVKYKPEEQSEEPGEDCTFTTSEADESHQETQAKAKGQLGKRIDESEDEGISGDESRELESGEQTTFGDENSDRVNRFKHSKHRSDKESFIVEQDMMSEEEGISGSDSVSETENEYSDPDSDSDGQESDIENDMGTLKKKKEKHSKAVLNSDSEGISGDESGTGSEYEITSIWENYRSGEDDRHKKKTKTKSLKYDEVKMMLGGNNVCKRKGTVEVRQLNLADQDSIDISVKENEKEVTSDSDDDFFIRDPVDKDKKNLKERSRTNVMKFDSDSEDSNNEDEDEVMAREKYLDNNFKRIWGMGTEETIKSASGRKTGGRGRGFPAMRDQSFRSRQSYNPNLMPLGMDTRSAAPMNNNYNNSDRIPVSSDWRSKKHSNFNNMSQKSYTEPEDKSSQKWKRGRFDKHENKSSLPFDSPNFKMKFSSGSRKREFSRGRGQNRRSFERNDQRNANLAPVAGNWRNNAPPSCKDRAQPSLLHPSWLAKQKEKQQASSINQFQGKVMKFD